MANVHTLATTPVSRPATWSFVKVINPVDGSGVVEMELQIEEIDVVCTGMGYKNKNNTKKMRRVAPHMVWVHPTDTFHRVLNIHVVDLRYPRGVVQMVIGQSAIDVLFARDADIPIGQVVDGVIGLSAVTGELSECCVCDDINFSTNYIECSNGEACLTQFFHAECMGLSPDYVPESWFCDNCILSDTNGAAAEVDAFIAAQDAQKSKEKASLSIVAAPASAGLSMEAPSPSIHANSFTADYVGSLLASPAMIEDYGLSNLDEVKIGLRAQAKRTLGPSRKGRLTAAGTIYTPNIRSWSMDEEEVLVDVVTECMDEGFRGQPLWDAVEPRLLARGINRAIGGAKMRWCRKLRVRTGMDERRKPDDLKLQTALQVPRTDRDPNAPKKGRFRGKNTHAAGADIASDITTPSEEPDSDIDDDEVKALLDAEDTSRGRRGRANSV